MHGEKVESRGYGLVVFFPAFAPGEHRRPARHWITAPGEKVRHFNECMRRGMKAVNRLTAVRVITDSWLSTLSDATLG